MKHVTKAMLETLTDTLNKETESPLKAWVKDSDNRYRASIGNHHISYAYGGACLHRMSNEGGGVSCPIINHHAPKRELYNLMWAYLQGIRDGKEFSLTHRGGE